MSDLLPFLRAHFPLPLLLALACLSGCQRAAEETTSANTSSAWNQPQSAASGDELNHLALASAAVQRGELVEAANLVQKHLLVAPDDPQALLLSAEISRSRGQTKQAVGLYNAAIEASRAPEPILYDRLARLWIEQGAPFNALQVLQVSVSQHPDDPKVRADFAGLAAAVGEEWKAWPHLQWLVQQGHAGSGELIMLADPTRPHIGTALCEDALRKRPRDLRPQYALARNAFARADWKEAVKLLRPVIERHPDYVPANVYYGRAVVELGDKAAIDSWVDELPEDAESYPQYWLAAGIFADQQGNDPQAARAFWEAVQLNENDTEALSRLAASLSALGRVQASRQVSAQVGKLSALRDAMQSFFAWRNDSQRAAKEVALRMLDLGRTWEAAGWARLATTMKQDPDPSVSATLAEIVGRLNRQSPWRDPATRIANTLQLDDLPQLAWSTDRKTDSAERSLDVPAATPLEKSAEQPSAERRFAFDLANEATQRGLIHTTKIEDNDGQEAGLWIYQSSVGGAGAIDYDLDGWPDLCFTNADGVPLQRNSSANVLFRNHHGRFQDVTQQTGTGDPGFSQGVTVGDYNADGFADLFVANIGRNTLYRNNGDGTFSDVTEAVGLHGELWSSSAAIADLDRDGHADLFEVAYAAGEQPFEQACFHEGLQEHRSCGPLAFPAQPDRVWQGNADGTFSLATDAWLAQHTAGRGLGLIVAELDETPGLDVYVANDMSTNHFWSRPPTRAGQSNSPRGPTSSSLQTSSSAQTSSPASDSDESFQLSEQAAIRGVAVNARSLSQASMGIATADVDGDADLDLFLTHFANDHNTFYEQVSAGMWVDRSTQVGLAEPSHALLGYGTEWMDLDNNGSLELLIANGNVDDFTHNGLAFRMPMQLFRSSGDGRYTEVDLGAMNEFFRTDRLARALITADVNRDGRQDAAVTHLFDPIALLINQTQAPGNWVRFFLKSTRGQPDAIGTRVSISAGGRTWHGQVTAGDGYQCSNERCVRFGIGSETEIDSLKVQWPSGHTESFGPLSAGDDYLLVEDSGESFRLAPAGP